jgi:hypothetical protein
MLLAVVAAVVSRHPVEAASPVACREAVSRVVYRHPVAVELHPLKYLPLPEAIAV